MTSLSKSLHEQVTTLGRFLGKPVFVVEQRLQPEDTCEETTRSASDDGSVQPQGGWEEGRGSANKAPQKFLTPEIGPRASTVAAYDLQGIEAGQQAEGLVQFCPWNVVTSYPMNYIGKTNRPHAKPFFDKILEGRVWDFFYLHNPAEPEAKPVLFVPSSQFQLFLDYVNKELDIALSIPGGANADRFLVQFDSNATHRPRYLKRSRDAKELEVPEWPELSGNDLDTFNNATPLQREQFVDKLRYATAPPVKDKIQGKAKAIRNRRERENMLMAMQALLGLGTSVHGGKAEMHDVVFVSVDVEAIERPPNPISEIGLAMLDGNGIRDIEPGARGENWWPMIQAHHLRTREYSGLVNHEFVEGCPDDFDFGVSTFPSKKELDTAVMAIFNPFIEANRDLILVGHDTMQDVHYLAQVGIDIASMKSVSRILDSQKMHQAWRNFDNGRGLGAVLSDLEISHCHLHNAGNDAVFTLRAAFGVAIRQMQQKAKATQIEAEENAGTKTD